MQTSWIHGIFSVEFPAVLLNTSNGEIEREFHHYVQPQENPILSDFCREFTGITQVNVHLSLGDSLILTIVLPVTEPYE